MTEETKTATVKLYRDNVPRITITYKDKKDLFKQFQKKLKEINLPIDEVYWADWDNDRSVVKTADDLFGAVEQNSTVRMFYRLTGESDPLTCPSSDEEEENVEEKKMTKKNEPRSRSPSPARRRHRSRSASSRPLAHPDYEQMPWNFAPWNFTLPFPHYPHASARSHRRRRDRSHHCSCERLSKDFGNL